MNKVVRGSFRPLFVLAFTTLILTPGWAQDTSSSAEDATAGEKAFLKCKSCHQVGEAAKNTIGPELNGIVGRQSASAAGYNYSDAMKAAGLIWTGVNLHDFIKNPRAKVVGTKMTFAGLSKDKDLDDLVAFLRRYDLEGKIKQ